MIIAEGIAEPIGLSLSHGHDPSTSPRGFYRVIELEDS